MYRKYAFLSQEPFYIYNYIKIKTDTIYVLTVQRCAQIVHKFINFRTKFLSIKNKKDADIKSRKYLLPNVTELS